MLECLLHEYTSGELKASESSNSELWEVSQQRLIAQRFASSLPSCLHVVGLEADPLLQPSNV